MDWWNNLPNSMQHVLWYYAQARAAMSGLSSGVTPLYNADGSVAWPPDERIQAHLTLAKHTVDVYYARRS